MKTSIHAILIPFWSPILLCKPLQDSSILIRKYYLGQSSKTIAEELGMSVSNVDTRTHRAIMKLRTAMGGNGNE